MRIRKHLFFLSFVLLLSFSSRSYSQNYPWDNGKVIVSSNHRFLQFENGKPFFWLFDTGWQLFAKCTREEAVQYLDDRKAKGFTGIQCMVIHGVPEIDRYGDSAFTENDPRRIRTTEGKNYRVQGEYDFWDHIEFVVDAAAQRGLYIGLVPVWGSVVKQGFFDEESAKTYAEFLAHRFKDKPNIFWIVGGDIQGDSCRTVWETIGSTLKKNDPNHLITFHPYGRTQSSSWFHRSSWLDFNMFQSGHRNYTQDNSVKHFGEDNWRYVLDDYTKIPPKPTLDGEPSYENIPQGLHDTTQPYWNSNDVRRYAYWSVFAGACGHTYGDNAVMQFYRMSDRKPAYGARTYWNEAIHDTGSFQMRYLENLILSRPYFERLNDQSVVAGPAGEKYDYVIVSRGKEYLMAYTYTGSRFRLAMGAVPGPEVRAWWFNPRSGEASSIGQVGNKGIVEFTPPGESRQGNDWVLVLDAEDGNSSLREGKFPPPGSVLK
jgi:hypothetical protein